LKENIKIPVKAGSQRLWTGIIFARYEPRVLVAMVEGRRQRGRPKMR